MNFRKLIHYSAVILGFQVAAFFFLFLISNAIAGLVEGKFAILPLLFLMLFSVGGYILAIGKPAKGGLIMISGGILMVVYLLIVGGTDEITMALIYGLPFIIPGLLFFYPANRKV